jgi:hypothetical protein
MAERAVASLKVAFSPPWNCRSRPWRRLRERRPKASGNSGDVCGMGLRAQKDRVHQSDELVEQVRVQDVATGVPSYEGSRLATVSAIP